MEYWRRVMRTDRIPDENVRNRITIQKNLVSTIEVKSITYYRYIGIKWEAMMRNAKITECYPIERRKDKYLEDLEEIRLTRSWRKQNYKDGDWVSNKEQVNDK